MSDTTPSALNLSVRSGAIMVAFTLVFTALMAATFEATGPAIAESAEREKMKLVSEVLPAADYDNAPLQDAIRLPPTPELGLADPTPLYRARKAGAPVALLMEAEAPDGYGGRIRLLVALRPDGRVAGVRVVAHRETPGLGDYIDPKKDRDKAAPWISQFTELDPARTPPAMWRVKKDGGAISAHAGATISARAVTNAVERAGRWAGARRDAAFAAPAGTILGKE